MLTLALSKGRIFDDTLPLLQRAGVEVVEDPQSTRKLILGTNRADLRVVLVRASDVPTYVRYGGADLGVAGLDVLLEADAGDDGDGLYRPVDLGIARCRLSVAAPVGWDYAAAVRQGARLRVATKYLNLAREHFAAKGVHVDLVSTGGTLRANGLAEVERILDISARLIVNQAAFKTRAAALRPLVAALRAAARPSHAEAQS